MTEEKVKKILKGELSAEQNIKNLLERMINREREQYGGHSGPVTTIEGELVD